MGDESAHHEDGIDAGEAVRVFVRIRPLNKREIAENQTIGWNFNETSMIEDTQNGQRIYAYDHCFGPTGTNQETYEIVGKPVVIKAMEGYNGTVFTYGQTGSGKTWTMRGCDSDPGMMVLCIRDIFEWVESHIQFQYILRVSYMEVYNEEINDLLGEGIGSKNLPIVSEDAARGAVIRGLEEIVCKNPQDFLELLRRGEASRSYASTSMNADSSRSHTIYRVAIEVKDADDTSSSPGRVSYLNLVDLAGSERQKSTNATGKVLKEGANINKSLLSLGAVISKLGEASKKVKGAKPVFIPYRDSKLTRILKQSLGGNTMTSMLCAVTPAPMHREETVSTLKFGQLCKTIKNNVKSNADVVDDKTLVKQYRSMIADLRVQLEEAQLSHVSSDIETSTYSRILNEKVELENRVRSLESLILSGTAGISEADLVGLIAKTSSRSAEDGYSPEREDIDLSSRLLQEAQAELSRHSEKNLELQRRMQGMLQEYQEFEEAKRSFEEYQQESQQVLDDEKEKLDREKDALKTEQYKLLSERNSVEEKEGRLGALITALDERDSKLRQMLGTLKEQQEQWQRSISDLQRREDLVDDWQRNHKARESRLHELDEQYDAKFLELNKRESALADLELKAKVQQRELSEREQRLQVALSRVANSEQSFASLEEKLRSFEANLKKREGDCDIKERELLNRRREMESWDLLLREKDRKVSVEQRAIDERDENLRAAEEKSRHKEAEAERRLLELRQNEASVTEQADRLAKLIQEAEKREMQSVEQAEKLRQWDEELTSKESDFIVWESSLTQLQERMRGIEDREQQLHNRILDHKKMEDDFFNVRVAQISSRHKAELSRLEVLASQQLQVVANFQNELSKTKSELDEKCRKLDDFQSLNLEREKLIDQLRDEIQSMKASMDFADEISVEEGDHCDSSDNEELDDESSSSHKLNPKSSGNGRSRSHHHPLSSNMSETSSVPGHSDHHRHDSQHSRMRDFMSSNEATHPSVGGLSVGKSSRKELFNQLADTQKVLRHVLESQSALPQKKANEAARLNQKIGSNRGFAGLSAAPEVSFPLSHSSGLFATLHEPAVPATTRPPVRTTAGDSESHRRPSAFVVDRDPPLSAAMPTTSPEHPSMVASQTPVPPAMSSADAKPPNDGTPRIKSATGGVAVSFADQASPLMSRSATKPRVSAKPTTTSSSSSSSSTPPAKSATSMKTAIEFSERKGIPVAKISLQSSSLKRESSVP